MRDEELYNQFGKGRISDRQIDELTGLARGLSADGVVNQEEAEFLNSWLAANAGVIDNPLIVRLFRTVQSILSDGILDREEAAELFSVLKAFAGEAPELGETLKSTRLPLCSPPPSLQFDQRRFCFTGTFSFGGRTRCEAEVLRRGGECGALTKKTNYLIIGEYATESWKHSSFGEKILKAAEMRDAGVPISIVSEEHWRDFLK